MIEASIRRVTAVSLVQLYAEHVAAQQEIDAYEQHLVAEQDGTVEF